MKAIMDMVNQQLGDGAIQQISQQIGADEGTTSQAISAALPLLLGALSRNASTPDGAQSLHQALANDHDGGLLDDVLGLIGNSQAANGAGILRHVLGDKRGAVESGLAQGTGLNSGSMGQLLEILAPLVMGALGRTQRQQGLDPSSLAGLLGSQQQESDPGLMGMLNRFLDADHDGSALDDIAGMAGKLFGGRP